jgi:hypothetical protein
MALRRFLGQAVAITNVWTITVTTASSGTVVGLASPTGNEITVTAGSGATTGSLASALAAALSQSPAPEFREFFWSAAGAVVTGTGVTSGKPSTWSPTGTSGAVTVTEVIAATGPNDGLNIDNWSGGALPDDTDDVLFDGGSASLLYGLSVLDGISLASVVTDNFSGEIGLPTVAQNANGGRYAEFRRRDMRLAGGFPVILGRGAGKPVRVVLRVGASATAVQVLGTSISSAGGTDHNGIYLTTTGTNHTLFVSAGTVDVATQIGDMASFNVVKATGNAIVTFGAGCTITALENQGARTVSYVALDDLLMTGGAVSHYQYAGDLNAVVRGGELHFSTAGALTVQATGNRSVVVLAGDPRPKTLGSGSSVLFGAKMLDPNKTRGASACLFDSTSLPGSLLGDGVTCT